MKSRPFVFINAAMSADGKISTYGRSQVKISGYADMKRVDGLRAGSDAIMVGIGTVLADNPGLTVKSGEKNPIRIVVDSMARTPVDAEVISRKGGPTIIAMSKSAPSERVAALREKAEIIAMGDKHVSLSELLAELKNRGIERLMVEGGATLNWSLISEGLVDEIYVYIGNMVIGGKTAPTLVDGVGLREPMKLELLSVERMDEGVLVKWRLI
ncbi:MAG: 2,5-diamino-6-(ribosylamino)-4(3H)-pyrimidinone 5'-phosphate reductase [Methanocellales archaeon]|nr:2,5-diamino-6-(ribosylamino)-4(3H)-pyrimidinone 5'-phosphate reductase [Methanocellales archaeon]MDD3291626.1 2,5-diamino-6-(ribosylamino)-4(3H)-pyrimidinone 5'-phosphate reductase [Methanocellales archaeon]MDD5235195.1 2,5-diamino-6-(ribosylamino)-4(3H)-pyrimidinone 5'-phosphate reductase [Methanocellales archaeon]MDD5485409.1 2,5-diamino-6-(ribosylamino)-4(3H)-pyrimidinone 5'-phosphate reductase [Methanocellales archaeon]